MFKIKFLKYRMFKAHVNFLGEENPLQEDFFDINTIKESFKNIGIKKFDSL